MELEESHSNKEIKKSASVRFAPGESLTATSIFAREDAASEDNDIDIRAEIQNSLPSNTLHRRKKTVFAPVEGRSFTLPHKSKSLAHTFSFNRARHLSYPTKKRNYLKQTVDTFDVTTAPDEGVYEQIQIPTTEEEKMEELDNIRSLPISMSEKKMYSINQGKNLKMDTSLEDIDARLARFEEENFEDDQNSSQYNSLSRNYESEKNEHHVYDKREFEEKEQRRGFFNNGFQDSFEAPRSNLQSSVYQGMPESKNLNDNFTVESNASCVDSYEQRVNFRKLEDKHFEYQHREMNSYAKPTNLRQPIACNSQRFPNAKINHEKEGFENRGTNFPRECRQNTEINSYAKPSNLSQPVACNSQKYQPNTNSHYKKEEFEIKSTNSPRANRQYRHTHHMKQSHENCHNDDQFFASQFHKKENLETPHKYEAHKLSASNYGNCDQIDCDEDFINNRSVKIHRDSGAIHGHDEYILHYSRYNDFKKNKNVPTSSSDFKVNPKKEINRKVTKAGNSNNSYFSYSDVDNIELPGDIYAKREKIKETNNFERIPHQSNVHKVTKLHEIGFRSSSETPDLDDVELKKRDHCIYSYKKKLRVGNPSVSNDSEINHIHCERSGNSFYVNHKSGMEIVNDTQSVISALEYSENNENVNVNKHNIIYDGDEETCSESEKTYDDIRRRKRKSTVNTLTMHDAQKIAPLLSDFTDGNFSQNRPENSMPDHEESLCRIRRKCWAKECWSTTKHSHGVNISKDLHDLKNRNAIMTSLQSPQYAAQAKKKTCADCWSSFLKASSSKFQLWNSTLKKIEDDSKWMLCRLAPKPGDDRNKFPISERQFGTGVVSYFVFLRWLIFLNFVMFILYFLLTILPFAVFPLLPHKNVKAPNETLFTEEYLEQFPKYENIPFSKKRISTENMSLNLDEGLLSNLGTLLDNYATDKIIDIATRYSKRNYTAEERYQNSLFCQERYIKEMANYTKSTFSFLQDFLQGTGWLQSTILFLGFYPDRDVSYFGFSYNLPIAFLAVLIVSFFLSLGLMLQYSSHGIEESILTQKSNYLTFSNILFCSWDYCIEDKKTADIRHKSITCEIKSNLAEEHRKSEVSRWSSEKRMKVYILRFAINILVVAALFGCFYLIYRVVNIQLEKQRQDALKGSGLYTLFIQFLPPLVITALNIIMPIIFSAVVKLEMYNSRTQVNIALFRIVFLRLASVFVLLSSLYQQITCEPKASICRDGKTEFCRTPICWETYVGQQLYKLVITDFLVYICMFLAYDLPRDFIVTRCKCKVTEVVGRQVFDLPSQVLSLVYSQTLCWLGLFYSPVLPGISVLKFLVIFYIKKLVVLKHCAPSPVLYKASRTNSIFMTILMLSLFVVTMIQGYCLTSIEPSPGCSPFRQLEVMIHAIRDAVNDWSSSLVRFMGYLFSAFFFIPSFILLILLIYYYWTIVVAHRKMTKVLKAQIAVEGRDKQFLLNRLAEAARQITAN